MTKERLRELNERYPIRHCKKCGVLPRTKRIPVIVEPVGAAYINRIKCPVCGAECHTTDKVETYPIAEWNKKHGISDEEMDKRF